MLLRILTVFAFLAFAAVVISMGMQTPFGWAVCNFVGSLPIDDKSLHFLILALLTVLVNTSLEGKRVCFFQRKWLVGSIFLGCLITFEECTQLFIPSRNFDFMDMVCNYAGIFAGGIMLKNTLPDKSGTNNQIPEKCKRLIRSLFISNSSQSSKTNR
jgi:glycopeptide antibiotics resistance protein